MGEIVGDCDVLEPIKGRDSELRSSDGSKGIDFVDAVNSSFDSVVDRIDVVLNGRPEIPEGGLEEGADLWQRGQTNGGEMLKDGSSKPLEWQR